jgi:predicted 3-demethylubiquinone-9 3-methyltransferase (glyoxalase superfamily)
MQKITTFLWFDTNAEEAVNFYVSIFKNARIDKITYYYEESAKAAKMPEGSVMTIGFQLEGQTFAALNGGPTFTFNPSISLAVNCQAQSEIDDLWEKLSAGGKEGQCGWLTDKYGLSWQVVPTALSEMLADPDQNKARQVMVALMQMKKLEISKLMQAFGQYSL